MGWEPNGSVRLERQSENLNNSRQFTTRTDPHHSVLIGFLWKFQRAKSFSFSLGTTFRQIASGIETRNCPRRIFLRLSIVARRFHLQMTCLTFHYLCASQRLVNVVNVSFGGWNNGWRWHDVMDNAKRRMMVCRWFKFQYESIIQSIKSSRLLASTYRVTNSH